ncbi:MAG: hypothetical protein Q4B26_00250 [Eubacteriales bacterium]|nr:hypothetical protein [Eubacteriales bacterium]
MANKKTSGKRSAYVSGLADRIYLSGCLDLHPFFDALYLVRELAIMSDNIDEVYVKRTGEMTAEVAAFCSGAESDTTWSILCHNIGVQLRNANNKTQFTMYTTESEKGKEIMTSGSPIFIRKEGTSKVTIEHEDFENYEEE